MGMEWGSAPRTTGSLGHRPGSEWEDVFGIIFVVLLATVGAVLAAGHASALIFDGAVPAYRVVDIPEILRAVAGHPVDPGRAWDPVNTGGRPPGPLAFYGLSLIHISEPTRPY